MTGFHLCPLVPAARGIIRREYLSGEKARIPIQERAKRLLASTQVSRSEVKWFCESYSGGEKSFQIGENKSYIRCGPEPSPGLTSSLIFHLAVALEGESFFLIVNRDANPFETVQCDLTGLAQKGTTRNHQLIFNIYPDFKRMELVSIESKGRGGRMMAALYNLARELNLERIEFYVAPGNHAARNFYYHIDAGYPIDSNNWVLPIRQGPYLKPQ